MSIVDRVLAATAPRAWPVGPGATLASDMYHGHDQSEFSPEEYGDYLATSNDIYSVVSLRARLMSGLDMRFYRGRRSDKAELPDDPAAQLYGYVNKYWTRRRLDRMHELCMGTWGESFEVVERDSGRPSELWWVKPSRMRPVVHDRDYISGYLYESITGERIAFKPDEVNWYRYPNPIDEFSPLSPLAASRLAADTARAMMSSNKQLFSQGMQLAGIVVPTSDKVSFTQEQAEDLELQLRKRLTGPKNAHKWAVLRYEAQFRQMSVTPKDAEFGTGLGMSFRQVCRAYGMPSPLLGDMDGATLANVREFEKIAWDMALKPDSQFMADEVAEQYLTKFGRRTAADHCEYDYSQIQALQESESAVWLRDAQALDRGAITINEWRRRNGLPDVEWGDRPFMPVNKAPLGPDGQLMLPEQSNDPKPPDDEVNPANAPASPRLLDHMASRKLLEAFAVNGVKL